MAEQVPLMDTVSGAKMATTTSPRKDQNVPAVEFQVATETPTKDIGPNMKLNKVGNLNKSIQCIKHLVIYYIKSIYVDIKIKQPDII